MKRHKLAIRLASGGAVAALALGAAACDMENEGGELDPGQEAPEDDAGLEGDDGLEGEGDAGLEGEGDAGLDDEGGDF